MEEENEELVNIDFDIDEETWKLLGTLAKKAGVTPEEYTLRLIKEDIEQRGPLQVPPE
jgi:hypothetical protein